MDVVVAWMWSFGSGCAALVVAVVGGMTLLKRFTGCIRAPCLLMFEFSMPGVLYTCRFRQRVEHLTRERDELKASVKVLEESGKAVSADLSKTGAEKDRLTSQLTASVAERKKLGEELRHATSARDGLSDEKSKISAELARVTKTSESLQVRVL